MDEHLSLAETQKKWHGSLKSYLIGFSLSILFTATAYLLVMAHLMTGKGLLFALVSLAIAQAISQLLFFLHVGEEAKPRWELLVCLFMIMVLLIIAFGSLWIMYDLNDRVMGGM
ncbi:MAG: cytochrome o ubiquinol oxidase subunit IV [Chlamydiales bacterium]|nr:cytochrome o ubiquinol oxidase subunit IV [Chlamydiales bacterium]